MSRIGVDEARTLWEEASDEELKRLAQGVRARWHEPDRATYMVMRIINYTNVCVAQCDYCAFYVLPNQGGGYVLSREDVFAKIDELMEFGGDLVAFNGGFNPRLPLERDPHRGLPRQARQVEVHGRRLLRGSACGRRKRHEDDGDDGDRLRRDAR
ncbi:MAG: hypothetical protein AUG88_03905 [Actinobacteria bacterium 13_1_20CM_4_68_12]|nr:MAG: hypothetical protein AUG88_03905 [Actinobacteria bacterium 13_1_20CM_4_68_12]